MTGKGSHTLPALPREGRWVCLEQPQARQSPAPQGLGPSTVSPTQLRPNPPPLPKRLQWVSQKHPKCKKQFALKAQNQKGLENKINGEMSSSLAKVRNPLREADSEQFGDRQGQAAPTFPTLQLPHAWLAPWGCGYSESKAASGSREQHKLLSQGGNATRAAAHIRGLQYAKQQESLQSPELLCAPADFRTRFLMPRGPPWPRSHRHPTPLPPILRTISQGGNMGLLFQSPPLALQFSALLLRFPLE